MIEKKLIEVAMPLDQVNLASNQDKSLRKGHPGSLHVWWAPRPLAAARAVLLGQLIDDPSVDTSRYPTGKEQDARRAELLDLVGKLSWWENATNPRLLREARLEIARAIARSNPKSRPNFKEAMPDKDLLHFIQKHGPVVVDPFAGGGRIPLEARRLGLRTVAVDLNPFPVLINTAHLRFLNDRSLSKTNVERLESKLRSAIGALCRSYYSVGSGGNEREIDGYYVVWFAKCGNPACGRKVPLSNGIGLGGGQYLNIAVGEVISVEIARKPREVQGDAQCTACNEPQSFADLRSNAVREGLTPVAVGALAKLKRGKEWLPGPFEPPVPQAPTPPGELPEKALGLRVRGYGLRHYWELYNPRQRQVIQALVDALRDESLENKVIGWLILIRLLDYYNILTFLDERSSSVQKATGPPTMQMRFGYCEINPLGNWSGNLADCAERVHQVDPIHFGGEGTVIHGLAQEAEFTDAVLSTDPPYYDMIGYAALSDQFYIWARELFKDTELGNTFATILTPKVGELIADAGRHGSAQDARDFFREGMRKVFVRARERTRPTEASAVYYSYKQKDTGPFSDAWESLLDSIIGTGWEITATWPIEAEMKGGLRVANRNSLANCIVLIIRPRPTDAAKTTRPEFIRELRRDLPHAIAEHRRAGIQPVDIVQAAIGPGMAIYSRHQSVLEPDGQPMSVREALDLVRQVVDETVMGDIAGVDAETSWVVQWFADFGFSEGPFGKAEALATMKGTSIESLSKSGTVLAAGNKVRLVRAADLIKEAATFVETGASEWKVLLYMIEALEQRGEAAAAAVRRNAGDKANRIQPLCSFLYAISERRNWNTDAQLFNRLGGSWTAIDRLSRSGGGSNLGDF